MNSLEIGVIYTPHWWYIGEKDYQGRRCGVGRYTQNDRLFYEGEFLNGEYEGFGYGEDSNGNVKCGKWKAGYLVESLSPESNEITNIRKKVRNLLARSEVKKEISNSTILYDADPNCEHVIVPGDNYSGIKCAKCTGWFCL